MGHQLFLVVWRSSGGMAELLNVGVVAAPDAKAARTKACTLFDATPTVAYEMHVEPIADLADGWSFFR